MVNHLSSVCFQRFAQNLQSVLRSTFACLHTLSRIGSCAQDEISRSRMSTLSPRQSMSYCSLLIFSIGHRQHLRGNTSDPQLQVWAIQSKFKCMFEWFSPKVTTNNLNISKKIKIKIKINQKISLNKIIPTWWRFRKFQSLELAVPIVKLTFMTLALMGPTNQKQRVRLIFQKIK